MAADATGVESVEIWRVSGLPGRRILAPLYYRLCLLDAERHPLGLSLSLPLSSYFEILDLVPRFDSTRRVTCKLFRLKGQGERLLGGQGALRQKTEHGPNNAQIENKVQQRQGRFSTRHTSLQTGFGFLPVSPRLFSSFVVV